MKGVTAERLETGTNRLLRMKHMKHDIEVKEIVIRTSVYPLAFYGCAIRPPGAAVIENFRPLAAKSLLGDGHNHNPAIVLLCAQGGIPDPEFWILVQVLRAATTFLSKSAP